MLRGTAYTFSFNKLDCFLLDTIVNYDIAGDHSQLGMSQHKIELGVPRTVAAATSTRC